MPFTLTVNPDEITGQQWELGTFDRLEVRPRTIDGQPFPGLDNRIIRADAHNVEDPANDGTYAVTLLSADVQPYGYEARIGTRMDWVVVPAHTDGATANLATFMAGPVTPFPFPSAEAQLAFLRAQVADLTDRLAALEEGGVTPAPGPVYPGASTYPSATTYPMGA